ncbi:nuclear transport factor 2 family protein [Gillisia marina]|uniref:nuclear transport factor 2 family protein n=1 Tax=Gillisia marina TaxID=1167637 RepID=UPI000303187C|nr:nuclear transport factor 2 family protein [Gillisia marina]
MRTISLRKTFVLLVSAMLISCSTFQQPKEISTKEYVPDNLELYNEIVAMDTEFFDAYNRCDLEKQGAIYDEDIEFFHDQGGVMTSKQGILDATEKNICGKVTRHLVPGSIEVYPIKDFGAIEFGEHTFKNNQESADTPSQIGKFVIFWKKQDSNWKITKVVSLH